MAVTTYNVAVVHVMNAYLWTRLQNDLGWTLVNAAVPIIPFQEQPEFASASQPYIIYNFSETSNILMWPLETSIVTYSVLSENAIEVTSAMGLIRDMFGRYDWSANDLNIFTNTSINTVFKNFDFKSSSASAEQIDPGAQEGARRMGVVQARVEYTFNRNSTYLNGARSFL